MNGHHGLRGRSVEVESPVGEYRHVGSVEAEAQVPRYTMDVLKTRR